MGLDMYLYKMKRFKDATPDDIVKIEDYLDWKEYMRDKDRDVDCTLYEWCGVQEDDVRKDFINFYLGQYKDRSGYGYKTCREEIGYWRKANHIHNWFVENVQNGIDECQYGREVKDEDLIDLLDICEKIIDKSEVIDFDEDHNPIYEIDSKIAERLLPRECGFFFGNYEYGNDYVWQTIETRDICKRALEETDFEKEMIYYRSSW